MPLNTTGPLSVRKEVMKRKEITVKGLLCIAETDSFVEVINEQQTMNDLQKTLELRNLVLLHAFPSTLCHALALITF